MHYSTTGSFGRDRINFRPKAFGVSGISELAGVSVRQDPVLNGSEMNLNPVEREESRS